MCLVTGRKIKKGVCIFGEVCPVYGTLSAPSRPLTDPVLEELKAVGITTVVVASKTIVEVSQLNQGLVKKVLKLDDIVNAEYLLPSDQEEPTS